MDCPLFGWFVLSNGLSIPSLFSFIPRSAPATIRKHGKNPLDVPFSICHHLTSHDHDHSFAKGGGMVVRN